MYNEEAFKKSKEKPKTDMPAPAIEIGQSILITDANVDDRFHLFIDYNARGPPSPPPDF